MSLIDVSVLKEWVYNWFTKNRRYHPYAKNNNIPITELYDILEQIPTIDPEPKWIPVSERLPDKADFYLTSSKSKQYPDDPYEVYTHISFYACGEWACTNRTVTAWMPLPESYRGDEDGQ